MVEIINSKKPSNIWYLSSGVVSLIFTITSLLKHDYWLAAFFLFFFICNIRDGLKVTKEADFIQRVESTSEELRFHQSGSAEWNILKANIEDIQIRAKALYIFYRPDEELFTCKLKRNEFDSAAWSRLSELVSNLKK